MLIEVRLLLLLLHSRRGLQARWEAVNSTEVKKKGGHRNSRERGFSRSAVSEKEGQPGSRRARCGAGTFGSPARSLPARVRLAPLAGVLEQLEPGAGALGVQAQLRGVPVGGGEGDRKEWASRQSEASGRVRGWRGVAAALLRS